MAKLKDAKVSYLSVAIISYDIEHLLILDILLFWEFSMSDKSLLLMPLLGMIFLTFGIMVWILKLRYRAVREDGLNPRYFNLYRGGKLPDYLAKVTQHFENLFEMPLFFYIGIILILVLDIVDSFYIFLAWVFFISRLIHTTIHTTYNKVAHRKNAFIISTLILIILWLKITIDIIGL